MGKLIDVLKSYKGGVVMDSKQKDDIKSVLKYTIAIICTIFLVFATKEIIIKNIDIYSLENDTVVGVLSGNTINNNDLDDLSTIKCMASSAAIIVDSFNIEVNGYKIQVADSVFGYVSNKEERDEILQKVCLSYINELGIDSKNVLKVYVNNNLKAIPEKVSIAKLESSVEIAENLYDAVVINENLLNMEIEVINNHEEIIAPAVVEEKSDELYMGQSILEEGGCGKKVIYTKEHYSGINKISEDIINEVVIKEAKPSVVKKGIKNPYYDGVRFLNNPLKDAVLTSIFGEARTSSYHKGIDLAKNLGEEVHSAYEGTVIFSDYNNGGYGNLVIVQHENDMQTYYAHLNEIYVSKGQYIGTEEVLGTVGTTGYSTGPHLHFELRVGGNPVDPTQYIL